MFCNQMPRIPLLPAVWRGRAATFPEVPVRHSAPDQDVAVAALTHDQHVRFGGEL
jgi:hypothetical protein